MAGDDITKLAQEVGAPIGVMAMGRHDVVLFTPHELEHFVALVEARAAAAERDACAKLCDERACLWPDEGGTPEDCASDIRARSQA